MRSRKDLGLYCSVFREVRKKLRAEQLVVPLSGSCYHTHHSWYRGYRHGIFPIPTCMSGVRAGVKNVFKTESIILVVLQ